MKTYALHTLIHEDLPDYEWGTCIDIIDFKDNDPRLVERKHTLSGEVGIFPILGSGEVGRFEWERLPISKLGFRTDYPELPSSSEVGMDSAGFVG